MRSVQAAEAKANLADILDAVERGESVLINRGGKTVARIIPEHRDAPENTGHAHHIEEAMATIKALRTRMSRLTMDDIISARHEGLA